MAAAPTPESARRAMRVATSSEKADARFAAPKSSSPAVSTVRRPTRSATMPAGSSSAAKASE